MPENAEVVLTPQNVPDGVCPTTIQEVVNTVAAYVTGVLPGTYSTFVLGNSTPAAADQNKPWIRTNVDDTFDKIYTFSGGQWTSPHPDFVGKIVIWGGDIANIDTLDGGSAGVVTTTTGPFWEEVTAAIGRTVVHPDPGGTVLPVNKPSVNGAFGEEQHTQTMDELVEHSHPIKIWGVGSGGGISIGDEPDTPATEATESVGGGQAFNVCQPSIALYYIRRTGRIYYTA